MHSFYERQCGPNGYLKHKNYKSVNLKIKNEIYNTFVNLAGNSDKIIHNNKSKNIMQINEQNFLL